MSDWQVATANQQHPYILVGIIPLEEKFEPNFRLTLIHITSVYKLQSERRTSSRSTQVPKTWHQSSPTLSWGDSWLSARLFGCHLVSSGRPNTFWGSSWDAAESLGLVGAGSAAAAAAAEPNTVSGYHGRSRDHTAPETGFHLHTNTHIHTYANTPAGERTLTTWRKKTESKQTHQQTNEAFECFRCLILWNKIHFL